MNERRLKAARAEWTASRRRYGRWLAVAALALAVALALALG